MRKIWLRHITLLLCIAVIFNACKEQTVTPPVEILPAGVVQGYVKSLNGNVPIQGVRAFISPQALSIDTQTVYSDINGFYKFTGISSGNKRILFSKGEFRDTIIVTVPPDRGIQVADARLEPTGRMAFVWGDFDEIQKIVRDSLGYALDSLPISDLQNLQTLQLYRMIFINCGGDIRGVSSSQVGEYISSGGKVYASDWAFECIKGEYPDLNGTYDGNGNQNVTASVTSTSLQSFLGRNTAEILYDLGAWLSLDPNNNPAVNVPFLRATYQNSGGTVTNNTIAFERVAGNGKLIYTTFHNEANVTRDAVKILMFFVYQL